MSNKTWRLGWALVAAAALWGCEPPTDPANETETLDGGDSDAEVEAGIRPLDAPPFILLPEDCIDGDGDTFGVFCPTGPDCDDRDPLVHENCGMPVVGTGAACDEDPSEVFECFSHPLETDVGGARCMSGTRSCLGGHWTECTFDREYIISLRRLVPLAIRN